MSGPLEGVRILDLTHLLNGPFCTVLLAHMGAEVLKIEHGAGDSFRRAWIPPDENRDGYEFIRVNTNKKGISLNLKTVRGKEMFCRLVEQSDVVAENFSVGVMDRLGLGCETLRAINPRLIYACSRGYGDSGPYAHVRSNAGTNMAMTGWQYAAQDLAGRPEGAKVLGVGDEAGGVSLALGICAALYQREKTGTGQKIEVSMQEALLGFMVSTFHSLYEGQRVGGPPAQCSDGHYMFRLADVSDDQMVKLCEAIGRPELAADPRYATSEARRRHLAELDEIVSAWVRNQTRQELWEKLYPLGILSAPVLSLAEVVQDRHLAARKAFAHFQHDGVGEVEVMAPWIRFSEAPCEVSSPPPKVGQHHREVYGQLLGLGDEDLEALRSDGVI